MRKVTIFILLVMVVSGFNTGLKAQNPDINILQRINKIPTIGFSRAITNSTTRISFGTPIVMGVAALLTNNDELFKNAIYVAVSMGVGGVLTQALKFSVNRPRPRVTYPDIIHAYEPETGLSFPSGHASLSFSVATALSLKYQKWYVIAPSMLWACSVCYSRMNLGVHYPSDVLTGAILGAGSAYLTYRINNWYWKKHHNKRLLNLKYLGGE